jgi:type II secretion system protein N
MMRALIGLAVVVVVGVTAVCLFTPTDDLLRSALPSGGANQPRIAFRSSALRPWGLGVNGIAVTGPDGDSLLAIDQLTIRPTLGALLRFSWRPLHVSMQLCAGTLSAEADIPTGVGAMIDARWDGLHFERCGLPSAFAVLRGQTSGTARLEQLGSSARPKGDGHLEITSARVPIPNSPVPDVDEVQLERFVSDWKLDAQKLTLADTAFKTPELEGRGQGTVQVRLNFPDSPVQLRFTIQPKPYAPPAIDRIMRALPPAPSEPGARVLIVEGTVSEPQVVRDE